MWDFLVNTLSHAGAQVVLWLLFAWYFFAHRKDPGMPTSRVGLIRMVVLGAIFVYFLLSWSSGIRPALAQMAVFGMFIINLYLIYMVALSLMERPYRHALEAYRLDPKDQANLDHIWGTGKRFYYLGFFLQALLSGGSPRHFLHEIASGRIRSDVQQQLSKHGEQGQFITLKGILAYLAGRLDQDDTLPQDFKDLVRRDLQQFGQHPWVELKVNEYLRIALEDPENIHNPEWSQMWEKAQG